ncbi:MAG TPA: arylamine N-acetyltransferase [Pilimelia sp.]|nr:arylamine N-acetyltransferase [Pilimelia sp.]
MRDSRQVLAYLDRLAVARPPVVDAAALRTLHRAHLLAVPFENLSIHLGEPVSLDPPALLDKLVGRRRGGFCYELNGAFALLLESLGCRVARLAARVFGPAGLGPPFDHLALLVHPADRSGPWLVDVGFGSHSVFPLRLALGVEQLDPAGRFTLVAADGPDGGDVDVLRDGRPQYRLERRERSLADFVPTCWWQQTSPESHFARGTVCSRLTEEGRISINNRRLLITRGGDRTERELPTDDALLAAYRGHFGIELPRAPGPDSPPGARRP